MAEGPEGIGRRGLSRRGLILAGGGALAAGAIKARVIDTTFDDLRTPEERITYFRTREKAFDSDEAFRTNLMQPVLGVTPEVGRAAYVHQTFSALKPLGMTKGVHAQLTAISPGIPAEESRFNHKIQKNEETGAEHIWQTTPTALKAMNQLLAKRKPPTQVQMSDLASLKVATPLAFMLLDEEIYPAIEGPAHAVLRQFGLEHDELARDQFLALCTVNAYNSGLGIVSKALRHFAHDEGVISASALFRGTPQTLFAAFSEWTYANRNTDKVRVKQDKGYVTYGQQSRQYVWKVLAGAESANAVYKLKYDETFPWVSGTKQLAYQVVQEGLKPAAAGIVGGLIGYAAGRITGGPGPIKPEAHTKVPPATDGRLPVGPRSVINRRRAFLLTALAGAAGAASYQAIKRPISLPKLPDVREMWPKKKGVERAPQQIREPIKFDDGTIYNPDTVRALFGDRLSNVSKLLPGPIASPDRALPEKNFERHGIEVVLKSREQAKTLHRITRADITGNSDAYQALVKVSEVNPKWRCRRVGRTPLDGQNTNDPLYMKVTKEANAKLEAISEAFQKALEAAGLGPSSEWGIRFVVNDLLRSDGSGGTRLRIPGASPNSAHSFGVGVDISNQRFDIIHKPTQQFFMTGATSDDITADKSLVDTLNRILGGVLEKMYDSNDIGLTYEPRRRHYHITAISLPPLQSRLDMVRAERARRAAARKANAPKGVPKSNGPVPKK